MMVEPYKEVSKLKLAARDALIPQEWRLPANVARDALDVTDIPRTCGLLTQQELDITENYDATALAEAIASRKLRCVEVTRAFCKRAAIAQQLTNCLTEILFDEALKRAAWLDHRLEYDGMLIGPLHGVPISLKDTLKISGFDSSLGIAGLTFRPATTTSPLVEILLNAGAVIYCKTNVPQTMMSLDSENHIFGRTLNPLNKLVTGGGSSGGEGVLVRMKGSVLGVGTDVGGSIRIPAYCNGVYGIKPSAHRVPYANQEGGVPPGMSSLKVYASAGPIARSLRDCGLFLKTVDAAKPWEYDPLSIPGLWSPYAYPVPPGRPLVIGIFSTDHLIPPLPPIANILKEVAGHVSKAGHRVVQIQTPPSFADIQSLASALFNLDGNNAMMDLLESFSEPLVPWLNGNMKRKKPKTLEQARNIHAQREDTMKRMQALWKTLVDGQSAEIDAIIAPVAPHPVAPIDRWGGVSYTSSFVLLDYPAGVLPVRMMEKRDLQQDMPDDKPLSSWDEYNRTLWNKKSIDRKVYLGTPLSVQVIAPRLQELRLYHAMEAIDDAIKRGTDEAAGKGSKARL